MAVAHYLGGEYLNTTDSGLSDGGTITLTGTRPGVAQAIWTILISALGTITVSDILISKADGSTQVARVGATAALPNGGCFALSSPIVGSPNDNMIVKATLTGATAGTVRITALYTLVNC